MSAGSEVRQSLESSASSYTAGIDSAEVGGNAAKAFYSAVTSKKPMAATLPQRSGISAADSGVYLDSTYNESAIAVGNSMHVALNASFSVAGQSATVFFALYDGIPDGADWPGYIGKTRDYVLTGDSYYKSTVVTGFVSTTEIVDIGPATFVYPIVRVAPTSGTVALAVEPM